MDSQYMSQKRWYFKNVVTNKPSVDLLDNCEVISLQDLSGYDSIYSEDYLYDYVEMSELRDEASMVLRTINNREEFVIRRRFWYEDTLKEVGELLSLTGAMIRIIEAKGLRKLRHPRRARRLRPFYLHSEKVLLAKYKETIKEKFMVSIEEAVENSMPIDCSLSAAQRERIIYRLLTAGTN